MSRQCRCAFFLALLIGVYTGDPAALAQPLVEYVAGGMINWTSGIVEAGGFALAAQSDGSGGQPADLKTISAARKNARQNLLATVRNIRVDSSKRVADVVDTSPRVMTRLQDMIYEAPEVEKLRRYQPDGTVQVQLLISLRGGFAQLMLPPDIRQIESIKQVSPPAKRSATSSAAGSRVPGIFSGLVVDARGILAEPALAPKIFDENRRQVFGPTFASREFAVQHGMVSYSDNIRKAQADPRVGDNPLVVKALRTKRIGLCDLVISNTDAAKLRRASEHLRFLKKCKVIIILDPL